MQLQVLDMQFNVMPALVVCTLRSAREWPSPLARRGAVNDEEEDPWAIGAGSRKGSGVAGRG